MTALTPQDADTLAGPEIKGRSLWADAWRRLIRNRAAVGGAIILFITALFCVFGPFASPHRHDQVYQAYIKVPASFNPYPHVVPVADHLDRVVDVPGVSLDNWRMDDGRIVATFAANQPIDADAVVSTLVHRGHIEEVEILGTEDQDRRLLTAFDPVAAGMMRTEGDAIDWVVVNPVPSILNRVLRQYDAVPVDWTYADGVATVAAEADGPLDDRYLRRSLDTSPDLLIGDVQSVADEGRRMVVRYSFAQDDELRRAIAHEVDWTGFEVDAVEGTGGHLTLTLEGEEAIDQYVLVENLAEVDDLMRLELLAREQEIPGYPAIEGGYYMTVRFGWAGADAFRQAALDAVDWTLPQVDDVNPGTGSLTMTMAVNGQLDPNALLNILSPSASELFSAETVSVDEDGRRMTMAFSIDDADPTRVVDLAMQRIDVDLISYTLDAGPSTVTVSGVEPVDERVLVRAIARNDDLFQVETTEIGEDGRRMALAMAFAEDDPARALRRQLRRSDAAIVDWSQEVAPMAVTVVGDAPIDRLTLSNALEADSELSGVRVVDIGEDGRLVTLAMDVDQHLFVFGTDSNGRDLMTRVMMGGRVSLMIGLAATSVSLLIGVMWGATAGYLGGRADNLMMRVVDILYSLPFMFFVILLVVFFGRNIFLMFIALGAVEWLDMARIVRGQTLSIKRKEYIEAAHAGGVRTPTIIRRHVVPNALGPVVVYMTLTVPKVILIESFLSFLGLGVQEPMTSWGVLIDDGARNMEGAIWMLAFPAIFLATTLFCLNFIGDGLRDALDPKDR